MAGAAIMRRLNGHYHLITHERTELDLCEQAAVDRFIATERPDLVIIAAAKVGGIYANHTYPVDFISDNLSIALNLINASHRYDVSRLLFLGSSFVYPREAPQPIPEAALLSGPLEATNEPYAIAKIAGIKLCQCYRRQYRRLYHSVMPCNLYGPGDNYHPQNAHVIPALIRRFHEAKDRGATEVTVWGTGTPRREFLYVDDCAEGISHLLQCDDPPDWINLGSGTDVTILEIAKLIKKVTGFNGSIHFDATKPDGAPCKRMDNTRMQSLGWQPHHTLEDGIAKTYAHFLRERETQQLRE